MLECVCVCAFVCACACACACACVRATSHRPTPPPLPSNVATAVAPPAAAASPATPTQHRAVALSLWVATPPHPPHEPRTCAPIVTQAHLQTRARTPLAAAPFKTLSPFLQRVPQRCLPPAGLLPRPPGPGNAAVQGDRRGVRWRHRCPQRHGPHGPAWHRHRTLGQHSSRRAQLRTRYGGRPAGQYGVRPTGRRGVRPAGQYGVGSAGRRGVRSEGRRRVGAHGSVAGGGCHRAAQRAHRPFVPRHLQGYVCRPMVMAADTWLLPPVVAAPAC